MLYTQIQQAFTKAVCNEGNWSEGKLNPNFIEADVYMEIPGSVEMTNEITVILDELFNKFYLDVPVKVCY
jgi:hypothetical protein